MSSEWKITHSQNTFQQKKVTWTYSEPIGLCVTN